MNVRFPVWGLSAAALALSACATHQTARLEAADTLANAPVLAAATNAPAVVGKTEAAWGDRYTAANLFERAVAGRDSVENRFNLASAYAATGRYAQAAAIYRTLMVDGEFRYGISTPDMRDPSLPVRRFNIADESARRLAEMNRLTMAASLAQPRSDARFAAEAAVPVSAIVGGPSTAQLSDAEAMRLDALSNP